MIELSPKITTPIFMLSPDQTAPVRITHLYDDVGDEVGTWEEATTFVAGPLDDGAWLSGPCADYQVRDPH